MMLLFWQDAAAIAALVSDEWWPLLCLIERERRGKLHLKLRNHEKGFADKKKLQSISFVRRAMLVPLLTARRTQNARFVFVIHLLLQ